MEVLIPLTVVFLIAAFVIYGTKKGQEKQKEQFQTQLQKQQVEAQEILTRFSSSGGLPVIQDPPVILQDGELGVLMAKSQLMEERAVRRAGYGGIRVARGVWIGGSQSEPHGELRTIDSGTLVLTNQRLVFLGTLRTSEIPLKKIVSITRWLDAIQINMSGRQKAQLFSVDNPLIWESLIKRLT
jgi:hypothetical protein